MKKCGTLDEQFSVQIIRPQIEQGYSISFLGLNDDTDIDSPDRKVVNFKPQRNDDRLKVKLQIGKELNHL